MEIGAYKPHFPESAEGRKKPSRFLEKIDGYINQLQKLKETVRLKEEAAPAAPAPAPAAAPAPQIEEVETSETVVEKGMGNLAISIIKDFGLRDPMLSKLMRASETLDETPEGEDIELPADEEVASAEGTDESGLDGLDLDLDLSGAAEAPAEGESAPEEGEIDLSSLGTDETPAEPAPDEEITLPEEEPTDEEEEPKKKSDEDLKKAQEELLGVEESEPLNLADFTFKN